MAKAPIPGTVKTRLVPFLSIDEAAELSRALLVDQLEHLRAISTADLYLLFSPREAGEMLRQLAPLSFELFPQTDGDLGARMEHAFETLFARGHKEIILIGGDLPPVPLAYFGQAFEFLNGPDQGVVLGPSRDGGYYLVGMNGPVKIFQDMTWSHDQVLAQTVAKLAALGIPMHQLPLWFDVDTPADIERLRHLDATAATRINSTLSLLQRWKDR
jgi:rSAM/selenodomain-associated transferase 1